MQSAQSRVVWLAREFTVAGKDKRSGFWTICNNAQAVVFVWPGRVVQPILPHPNYDVAAPIVSLVLPDTHPALAGVVRADSDPATQAQPNHHIRLRAAGPSTGDVVDARCKGGRLPVSWV